MPAISAAGRAGASVAALLFTACGPPRGIDSSAAPASAPKPLPPRPLTEVFVLEAAGAQPNDTTVAVTPGAPRVVVLRRSPPDNGLFATLEFGDSALKPPAGGTAARLIIRPRAGEYALDLEVQGTVREGATILFSYGTHFVAPAGARERYGSDIYFERELAIGRMSDSNRVVFLPTIRPGSDMLRAPLPGPGRYLVAAPR